MNERDHSRAGDWEGFFSIWLGCRRSACPSRMPCWFGPESRACPILSDTGQRYLFALSTMDGGSRSRRHVRASGKGLLLLSARMAIRVHTEKS